MNSFYLELNNKDFQKALVVAILAPVAGYVGQVLQVFAQGGSFAIDPGQILHFALVGFFGYLGKNLLSDENGKVLGLIG